jgi:hypothetical protein
MTRFESPNTSRVPAADEPMAVTRISELSPAEIEDYVSRARVVRSAYFAAWCKRVFQNWASVLRRPGRLAPPVGH